MTAKLSFEAEKQKALRMADKRAKELTGEKDKLMRKYKKELMSMSMSVKKSKAENTAPQQKKSIDPVMVGAFAGIGIGVGALVYYLTQGQSGSPNIPDAIADVSPSDIPTNYEYNSNVGSSNISGGTVTLDNSGNDFDMSALLTDIYNGVIEAPSQIVETMSNGFEATYNYNYSTETYDAFVKTTSGQTYF